jgi:long-subunit acyl-CoA synthetase (AMP-forming)
MISHEAVVSVIASKLLFLDSFPGEALTQKDSLLSFLPLAHIFDRLVPPPPALTARRRRRRRRRW